MSARNSATNNNNNNVVNNTVTNSISNSINNNISNNTMNNINNSINTIDNDSSNVNNMTIYTVEYASYINANILSLVIKSKLKEGDNPQRVIIQTYNYNLSTNEEITLDSVLEIKGLDHESVNNTIKSKIKQADEQSESLKNLGYKVYSRDLSSDMYDIQNATNFILGKDNHLYIIYAYGNTNFTDEMDVVVF